ncbi:hypothetical protein [Rothia terrae]|uniref:hypothetical protein n=1 Tax=Rothia terrae TaxID=396015 RepID=UPI0028829D86|nr:hypothetical protein [Rothia terrae]MDT0189350.1 hypothetical protein [Rothia terrae]
MALPLIAMTLLPPIPQPWSFIVAVLFTGLVIYEYNKNQLNNQPGHEMVRHWAMWAYIALLPASLIAFLLLDSFAHLLLAAFILVALSLIFTS